MCIGVFQRIAHLTIDTFLEALVEQLVAETAMSITIELEDVKALISGCVEIGFPCTGADAFCRGHKRAASRFGAEARTPRYRYRY